MAIELLAFANFEFSVHRQSTKVIIGDRVQEEERFVLNWKDYLQVLRHKGIKTDHESRSFMQRYAMPRAEHDYFRRFTRFQDEVRDLLATISRDRVIQPDVWNTIFRESEKLGEVITTNPLVTKPVTEEDLGSLKFEKQVSAETYRAFLFGQIRDLILSRKVFRIRQCPECEVFFMDSTRNANKVYCSIKTCGNRAKQRAFQQRRAEKERRNQSALEF
jgi:hypothetical protein